MSDDRTLLRRITEAAFITGVMPSKAQEILEAAGLPDLMKDRDEWRQIAGEAADSMGYLQADLAAAQERVDTMEMEANMASEACAAAQEFADSSEHPNWQAGWDAGYSRGKKEARADLAAAQAAADEWKMQANAMAKALGPVQDDWRDAQAAAKDFAFALHMLDVAGMPGVTGVKELLAAHPEFAPDKDGAS